MTAWELVLTTVGGVFVCGAFWEFIRFLISRKDEKKKSKNTTADKLTELQKAIEKLQESVDQNNKDMDAQSEAIMSIAQDRILWLGEQYRKQGYVKINDYVSIKRMADAYRALGGNDLVKTMMDEVDLLEKR